MKDKSIKGMNDDNFLETLFEKFLDFKVTHVINEQILDGSATTLMGIFFNRKVITYTAAIYTHLFFCQNTTVSTYFRYM